MNPFIKNIRSIEEREEPQTGCLRLAVTVLS